MAFYTVNPKIINWKSNSSAVFFNPKLKVNFTKFIKHLPKINSCIWLSTSGRTQAKLTALSKSALLASAQAVNQHLQAKKKDRWGLSLPLFHVGGLSILARAFLSASPCFRFSKKWNPKNFHQFLIKHKISLNSLVPTQLYDLVQAGLESPPSLRALIIGGESLDKALYHKARKLGWPVLTSYGLTECSSQTAAAPLSSLKKNTFPPLKILPHVQVKIVKGNIALKSKSLLTGFVSINQPEVFKEPKKSSWFITKDKGVKTGEFLRPEGDSSQFIKILGEKVSLKKLENLLMILLLKHRPSGRFMIIPAPSDREGFQIALVGEKWDSLILPRIIQQFNQQTEAFERIRQLYLVPFIPLTGISKPAQKLLLKTLNFSCKEKLACTPLNNINH